MHRHTIMSTKKQQIELNGLGTQPSMQQQEESNFKQGGGDDDDAPSKIDYVLDEAFASTHMQIFSAISILQRRLLLIQSGITGNDPAAVCGI